MADNFENETNDLIDNAAANLINASAKEQADEIRAEAQGSMDAENSAIQQNTTLLQQNAQAQKSLNEEKQKTLTIQQAIDNAVAESMRQRNEMLVYHGSGSEFKNFSNSKINSGVGGQLFGNGHYFSENKALADSYAKEYDKPITYFAAIPKDNGSNYVDWEKKYNISELIGKLSEATRTLLGNLGKVDDTNQLISGKKLVERLQRINLDSTVLPEMGFTGVKYPTASGRNNNYTVYSSDDIRVIKREALNQPDNLPYYNPITYVDESLKSAIENSNFDGARFIFDIAEAIKNKIIPSNGTQIASGSFVIGPSPENMPIIKVHDMILTNDGRLIKPDPKDTLVAMADPQLSMMQARGYQSIRSQSGEVIGILADKDMQILEQNIYQMTKLEERLGKGAERNQDYQDAKAKVDSLLSQSKELREKELPTSAELVKQIVNKVNSDFQNGVRSFDKPAQQIGQFNSEHASLQAIVDQVNKITLENMKDRISIFEKKGFKTINDADGNVIGLLSKEDYEALQSTKGIVKNYETIHKHPDQQPGYDTQKQKEAELMALARQNLVGNFTSRWQDKADALIRERNEDLERQTRAEVIARQISVNARNNRVDEMFPRLDDYNYRDEDIAFRDARRAAVFRQEEERRLREAHIAREVSQWKPQQDSMGSILDNVDTIAMTQHRHDIEAKRDALISGYNQSAADEILNEFFDALDNFDKLPPLEKVKQTHEMMKIISSMEELINTTPELQGKLEGFDKLKNTFLAGSIGGWGSRMATYDQPTIDESAFRNEDNDYWEQRRDIQSQIEAYEEHENQESLRYLAEKKRAIEEQEKRHQEYLEQFGRNILNRQQNRQSNLVTGNEWVTQARGLDNEIATLRTLLTSFNKFSSIAASIENNPMSTVHDLEIVSKFNARQSELGNFGTWEKILNEDDEVEEIFTGSGLLGQFHQLKKIVDDVTLALNDENISEVEKAQLIEDNKDAFADYDKVVSELNKKLKHTVDETRSDFSKNDLFSQNPYASAKYALKRDKTQQEEFREDNPFAFSTTGMMKESFLKTVFNKSVGFRQQQGLVGFAANLGYNKSGTALSIGLGTLASAVKKAGQAMLQFSKESVEAYGGLQSIKTNLGIVYGSQSEADRTFGEIAQYSVKSPFGVQTVSEYAVLLKQSGIYASDLMDTLKQIGDVAGGNQQKFANIANAFSQIEANGKATTRQLRQFATAGIPIYKELSKELGVGIEQIRKMTEQGKISSSVIEKVFANMTGPGGTFENAVNIGAKTWKARQQNLADAKQLAQASVGEYLIGAGGTGRGDSLAEFWLNFKETFFDGIKNIFTDANLKKSISNVENQDRIVSELKEQYETLKEAGASEDTLKAIKSKLDEAVMYISPEKQRSIALTAYQAQMEKIEGKEVLSPKELKSLQDTANSLKYAQHKIENDIVYKFEQRQNKGWIEDTSVTKKEYNNWLKEKADARTALGNSISQKDYNKAIAEAEQYKEKALTAMSDIYLGSIYEKLDKAANKNNDSLYLWSQKSNAAYKQTSKGKLAQEEEERIRWNTKKQELDKARELIDENGNVLTKFSGTMNDLINLMMSGVINPLEEIELLPEKLANDFTSNLAENPEIRNKQLKSRASDFRFVQESLSKNIETLLNTTDISSTAVDLLTKFRDSALKDGDQYKENSGKNITKLTNAISELVVALEKSGNFDAATIIGTSTTRKARTAEGQWYDEANKGNDVYPLWQRIINSSLGVDLEHFKNKTITNGRQGLQYWEDQSQRETAGSLLRTKLQYRGLSKEISEAISKGRSSSTGNNSEDGTKLINWKETVRNFNNLNSSLQELSATARVNADSLNEQINALDDFLVAAMTTTEDAANIYDPAYRNMIGEWAGKLEASGINAYDIDLKNTGDDIIAFRENAIQAASELLTFKTELSKVVNVQANLAETLLEVTSKVKDEAVGFNAATGSYNKGLLKNFSPDQIKEFAGYLKQINRDNPTFDVNTELLRYSGAQSVDELYSFKNTEDLKNEISDLETKKAKTEQEIKTSSETRENLINEVIDNFKKTWSLEPQNQLNTAIYNMARKNGMGYSDADKFMENQNFRDFAYQQITGPDTKKIENANNRLDGFNKGLEVATKKLTEFESYNDAQKENINNSKELIEQMQIFTRQSRLKSLEEILSKQQTANSVESLGFSFMTGLHPQGMNKLQAEEYKDNKALSEKLNSNWKFRDNYFSYRTGYQGNISNDLVESLYLDENGRYTGQLDREKLRNYWELAGKDFKDEKIQNEFNSLFEDGENTEGIYKSLDELRLKLEQTFNLEDFGKRIKDLGQNMKSAFESSVFSEVSKTFYTLGKYAVIGADASEEIGKNWKHMAASLFESIGPQMTMTGLQIAGQAAMDKQWGIMFAALTMAGVGAAGSFAAGMLSDDKDKDKQREETLKNLKSLLADIIEQAKIDAEYYEKNMRHGDALSRNEAISVSSVNDAIIAPGGKVITTAPDDYLIATKTPGSLAGNGEVKINFQMIDQSSGAKVQTKEVRQSKNADGSIDIKAIVVAAVSEAVANGDMDDAFSARDSRMAGRQYV